MGILFDYGLMYVATHEITDEQAKSLLDDLSRWEEAESMGKEE